MKYIQNITLKVDIFKFVSSFHEIYVTCVFKFVSCFHEIYVTCASTCSSSHINLAQRLLLFVFKTKFFTCQKYIFSVTTKFAIIVMQKVLDLSQQKNIFLNQKACFEYIPTRALLFGQRKSGLFQHNVLLKFFDYIHMLWISVSFNDSATPKALLNLFSKCISKILQPKSCLLLSFMLYFWF